MLEIIQIFEATTSLFITLQIRETNNLNNNTIQGYSRTISICFVKLNTRNSCQQLQPEWWIPQPNNLMRLKEQFWSNSRTTKAKGSQRLYQFLGIIRTHCNPDIHVTSGTRIPMVPNRIPTDKQILNHVLVQ